MCMMGGMAFGIARRGLGAAALALGLAQAAAQAQDGAARYAGVQLEVAESFLRQARVAAARDDFGRAGRLAWQASIDARLTLGMTDSAPLRAQAAEVAREAAALIADIREPEDLRQR